MGEGGLPVETRSHDLTDEGAFIALAGSVEHEAYSYRVMAGSNDSTMQSWPMTRLRTTIG
jgi:hypothetical protein